MNVPSLHLRQVVSSGLQLSAGFAILTIGLMAGAWLGRWLNLPIAPGIVGMVLLLAALPWMGKLTHSVEATSRPLLKHMMLFFIPAVVGVMEQFQALRLGWLPFLAACIAGAALTVTVTALTLQMLLKRQRAAQ